MQSAPTSTPEPRYVIMARRRGPWVRLTNPARLGVVFCWLVEHWVFFAAVEYRVEEA